MKKNVAKKRFIFSKTISNSIRKNKLMPIYSDEERKGKVGSFNVKTKRSSRLNYYGNPVYSVEVKDRKTGVTANSKSTYLNDAIASAIKKTGCKIKK